MRVRTGLDRLAADPALIAGRRFAVLANQASVTAELVTAWRVLAGHGGELVRVLAPEHGLWGVAQDMEAVGEESEPAVGMPVHSLYGSSVDTLAPRPEWLEGLAALVVDLPDIGTRYYTFAATLAHAMAACEKAGVEVLVLDRPNPIGGVTLEGGPVEPGCRSFVGEIDVPVRHGLTLGELALLLRGTRHPDLALTVLMCEGWSRGQWWDEAGLPWVAPSPNMPTLTTAAIYPGACLVEATNLSEGRGTTRPFELVGAPWLDGDALARALGDLRLPGVAFRATRFRPEFGKHAHTVCGGVQWHVTDRRSMRALETGMHLLAAVRRLHPDHFAWRADAYEFVADVPAIDLLTGSPAARAAIEGRGDLDELLSAWAAHCVWFEEAREAFLLHA
ncbi:MAG: exo-beta-N-acetylmuramidase NamZ domain-containing protein [Thermoanaerobaculaceae bacterium]